MQPGGEPDHHLPSLTKLSPQVSLDLTAHNQMQPLAHLVLCDNYLPQKLTEEMAAPR